ncbi:unnamed protein product [Brassica napus]|uniref:(rape) hypothetical protein n=1 Tax=Brassica napus TaxID=3708 RepID=A0A816SIW8_BRANA|nr:unnamed protein product [Brassica napus]
MILILIFCSRRTSWSTRNERESSDIKDLISHGYDLINLLNSKNGFDVIQKSIKDCKKKTEEAYSDESTGDDDIERLQKELDEDMELESKINDALR